MNIFDCDFAGYGGNREADAPEKSVQPSERNIKYNICAAGDQNVS